MATIVHVVPHDEGWAVMYEGGLVVSVHPTQAEAEDAAKQNARSHGGIEVVVHGRDEEG